MKFTVRNHKFDNDSRPWQDEEVLPLDAVLSQLPVDLPMGKLLVLSAVLALSKSD